jgi:hypothetical protein
LIAANEQESQQREDLASEKKKLLEDEKELMGTEGTRRLETSLSRGDFTDVQAAHALIKV